MEWGETICPREKDPWTVVHYPYEILNPAGAPNDNTKAKYFKCRLSFSRFFVFAFLRQICRFVTKGISFPVLQKFELAFCRRKPYSIYKTDIAGISEAIKAFKTDNHRNESFGPPDPSLKRMFI